MPKAYWISAYRSVRNPDALAAYAKLALPACKAPEDASSRAACLQKFTSKG
jgi:hypothetical protein